MAWGSRLSTTAASLFLNRDRVREDGLGEEASQLQDTRIDGASFQASSPLRALS